VLIFAGPRSLGPVTTVGAPRSSAGRIGVLVPRVVSPAMVEPLDIFAPGTFVGTTALVTGGGTGIGRDIALGFARGGADVVIASRDPEHLADTAAQIRASGVRCLAHPVNIRETESVEALRDAVVAEFGGIDHLINNAGGQFPALPSDISDNGWRAVVDLNLNGTWNMISRFAPGLVERGGGSIVNIVHLFSFERAGPFVHSGAARAGVVQMSYTLAQTLGRAGVRVNAVAPGTVDTLGMQSNEAEVIEELEGLSDLLGDVAANIPAGRLGEPDEVAATVLFLCSAGGRWINGVALRVDGGEYAGNWVPLFPGRAF
jgi:NAD(P)-dependent dehydrogenase (short-subunit alcohol dehydrogenase family)